MENKEVIEILIKYFKKQKNTDDLYRALANLMIDCGRMVDFSNHLLWIGTIDDEDEKLEYEKFMNRMKLNCEQLKVFIMQGDNGKVFSCGESNA